MAHQTTPTYTALLESASSHVAGLRARYELSRAAARQARSHADDLQQHASEDQRRLVGAMRAQGRTLAQVGAQLGITRQRVHQIEHGK